MTTDSGLTSYEWQALQLFSLNTTTIYPNSTESPVIQPFPDWLNALAFLGICIFAIPSTLGNIVVAATILYKKKLRNEPTYMAMIVLAATDLPHTFVAVYPMGGSILVQHNVPSYETRLIPLNVIYPAWYVTCVAYMTIAVNRWLAVCYPDLNKLIFSRRNMLIWMSMWPAISVACMAPMLSGQCCPLDFSPAQWLLRYEEGREAEKNVQLMICYLTSAATTAVSCLAYPLAFWKIRKLQSFSLLHRPINGAASSSRLKAKARTRNADIKLIGQFMMLTGVFTFTWITIHFEASLGPANAHGILCYFGLVGYAAMTGVNSLIYFTMNKTLRRGAMDLFLMLLGKDRSGLFSKTSLQTASITRQRSKCSSGVPADSNNYSSVIIKYDGTCETQIIQRQLELEFADAIE